MQSDLPRASKASSELIAYLVVREGSAWRDVYRLTPGQVTTVGRAPTNRIVVPDDLCSRNHCEVFQSGSRWTLRDLASRNGTLINGQRVNGDCPLQDGDLIRIGKCHLGFTYDISVPFPPLHDLDRDTDAEIDVISEASGEWGPAIIHRARDSRYRSLSGSDAAGRDRTSRELARLYRLALEMGTTRDSTEVSQVVLEGLLSGTSADIGAILLLPKRPASHPRPEQLQVIAYRSQGEQPYQRVSDYLTRIVLAEREAVLARDVADDSGLSNDHMLDQLRAKSVICAPIRHEQSIHGLIHLYSTSPEHALDPDDLEFTLAVADQLAVALESLKEKESLAVGLARVRDENQALRRQLELESELVGDSPTMHQLRETISLIAPTDATVLIRGESGVGKELVARAVHFGSDRREGPFVCMNCAALTESLLESELFGHEKGSFTGATGRKLGKFEQAHQGSLFLDEVGEMSLAVQAKFLRVLEGHQFERVGGGSPIKVNVRVVAATNRHLEKAVEAGTFRSDLYFRLHVVEITVDPLRERRPDIPLLANHFLARFAGKTNRTIRKFTPAALEALTNYDWPGNVRELQNVVERAVILCAGEEVNEDDIRLSALGRSRVPGQAEAGEVDPRQLSLDELEQEHILAVLERTNWNKSRAAQILGIERSTLDRKLKRYNRQRPAS